MFILIDILFLRSYFFCFFFNDTATTEIYTLSLHDALPICFRDGGHADQRCAQRAEGANLGGGLIAGPGDGEINSFAKFKTLFAGGQLCQRAEGFRVGLGHVSKTKGGAGAGGKSRLVRSDERVPSHVVDVVAERHKLTQVIALLDASGGVGEDGRLDAHRAQHAHGKGDLLGRVAFVKMYAALHDDDRHAAHEPGDNPAGVTLDGGLRKMWNLRVGNGDWAGDSIGHGAQSGAEDDGDTGAELAQFGSEKRGCFRDLVVVGHKLPEEVL